MAPKKKAAPKATASHAEEVQNEEEVLIVTPVVGEVAAPTPAEAEEPAQLLTEEVQSEAAEAAAEAPYVPVEVSGSVTEVYSQLQSILANDADKVNYYLPQLLELVHAAESPETPLLMRVRFVEFVGQHVAQVRDNAALRKIVTTLVKVVGGEDNTPQLLTAAVQAFAGLGPVSVVDKNWEYLAREGADVLMQIMIDRDAFPEAVRVTAVRSLEALTQSAFRPVLAKLLHWLSLDREEDDEEQLSRERHMALTRLSRLVMAQSLRKHWTEETEQYLEPLLRRVFGTVDAREFAQLARLSSQLPMSKSKGNIPILEWYVGAHPLTEQRHVEAVAILGRYVDGNHELDLTPVLESAGIFATSLAPAEDASVDLAKVLLVACRTATVEGAEKLYPYVLQQVSAIMADVAQTLTSANLIAVEAILFAYTALARKKSTEVLQQLNDEAFNASATAAIAAVTEVYNQVLYAVKKASMNKEATKMESNAVASLRTIKSIFDAFAHKRLPLGDVSPSWTHDNMTPTVKPARDRAQTTLPPPPGSHAAEEAAKKRSRSEPQSQQHQPKQQQKRPRNEQKGDRNRSGSKSQGNNSRSNNRSSSRGDRRPRH